MVHEFGASSTPTTVMDPAVTLIESTPSASLIILDLKAILWQCFLHIWNQVARVFIFCPPQSPKRHGFSEDVKQCSQVTLQGVLPMIALEIVKPRQTY